MVRNIEMIASVKPVQFAICDVDQLEGNGNFSFFDEIFRIRRILS